MLEPARPFFEELGEAMAGREVVLVPGNHDHRLAEPLLERVASGERRRASGLEQRAGHRGEPAAALAGWLGDAELTLAYPGVWLRDDVYATHGHYMDCHMSLPRIECIAAAAVMRAFGPVPDPAGAGDYERVLRPVYGFSFGLAQSGLARRATPPLGGRLAQDLRPRPPALAPAAARRSRAAVGGGIPADRLDAEPAAARRLLARPLGGGDHPQRHRGRRPSWRAGSTSTPPT